MDSFDVGYVAGAHGVHGAVRIKLHDPLSEALADGVVVTLSRDGSVVAEPRVRGSAPVPGKPGMFRVELDGVEDRDAAADLKGCTVTVPRVALPPLADDEFYLADAIGLPVVREAAPRELGTIVALTSNGVQDLFDVEWVAPDDHKHRWLLPVLPHLVKDVTPERVLVELPPGLLPEELELP